MVILLTLAGILAAGGLMLYLIGRLAHRRGESAIAWSTGLALVWGFIWIISRATSLVLGPEGSPTYQRWHPWLVAGSLLMCVITFALYYAILDGRTRSRYWDDRVEEIGEEE